MDSDYYFNYNNKSDKSIFQENERSSNLNATPSNNSKINNFSSIGQNSRLLSDYKKNDNDNDNKYILREIRNKILHKILENSFEIEIIKYKEKIKFNYNIIKNKDFNECKIIGYEGFNKINNFCLLFIQDLEKIFKNELNNYKEFKINIEIKFELNEYNDINNIRCIYILINPKNNKRQSFKDDDILYNKNKIGLYYLVCKIRNEINIYIQNIVNYKPDSDNNKYSIIKLVKKIGNPDKSEVEFIKELSNGFYISVLSDHKLIIYNQLFESIIQINDLNELKDLISFNFIYNICEICEIDQSQKKENEIQLFIFLGAHLIIIKIDIKNITYKISKQKLENMSWVQCIEAKNNNYIFLGSSGLYHLNRILSKNSENNNEIIHSNPDTKFINGIKINENIIALISNNVYRNGEDKLCFYHLDKKTITHEIKGYSFTNSLNGLSLMNINEKNNNSKILLCACQNYNKKQINGILLVELLKDNEEVYHDFYKADFKVQCLCPIINIEKENSNNIINKNINSSDTSFFLVGGFDTEKRIGIIKLFKVIYDVKILHYKIEFITEVNVDTDDEDFEGFQGIKGITQSKETGDILITCFGDSNVYVFKFHCLESK